MIEKFKTNAEVIENGDKYLYGCDLTYEYVKINGDYRT